MIDQDRAMKICQSIYKISNELFKINGLVRCISRFDLVENFENIEKKLNKLHNKIVKEANQQLR